jgi:hypothetical protein
VKVINSLILYSLNQDQLNSTQLNTSLLPKRAIDLKVAILGRRKHEVATPKV